MTSTISRLSALLHSGQISSTELTKLYMDEIEKQNGALNAYVHKTYDEALANAAAADRMLAAGNAPVLCGIPMTLKDNIATDGMETTCCSKILRGYRPIYDATVWTKLKAQGAVLLGKTNMDEFAMGSTSETSVYGRPKNPRDLGKVTGGSSGGGAAAVCAHIAAYAIGSDTGGSIRQPSSFCGVVGFKPTYGAVSRYGLIAYGSSLDQIGPLATSVSDAAVIYDAIKGMDPMDMTSNDVSMEPTQLESGEGACAKGLRIGIAKEFFEGLSPEMTAVIMGAAEKYREAGAELVELSVPSLKAALPVYYIIACAEASSNLGRYDGIRYGFRASNYSSVDDMVIKTRTEGFGREVQKRIMLGTYVLSSGYMDAYYKKACLLRERIQAEMNGVFEKCDVLFAPTVPVTAFDEGYSGGNAIETYLSDVCTVPVNIAGLPGISIPAGKIGGMPAGLQIIGNRFQDAKVLRTAHIAEREGFFDVEDVKGGVQL